MGIITPTPTVAACAWEGARPKHPQAWRTVGCILRRAETLGIAWNKAAFFQEEFNAGRHIRSGCIVVNVLLRDFEGEERTRRGLREGRTGDLMDATPPPPVPGPSVRSDAPRTGPRSVCCRMGLRPKLFIASPRLFKVDAAGRRSPEAPCSKHIF